MKKRDNTLDEILRVGPTKGFVMVRMAALHEPIHREFYSLEVRKCRNLCGNVSVARPFVCEELQYRYQGTWLCGYIFEVEGRTDRGGYVPL